MWELILSIALQLIGMVLTKVKADQALRQAFLDFITHLESKQLVSVEMRKSYQDQLGRLTGGKTPPQIP